MNLGSLVERERERWKRAERVRDFWRCISIHNSRIIPEFIWNKEKPLENGHYMVYHVVQYPIHTYFEGILFQMNGSCALWMLQIIQIERERNRERGIEREKGREWESEKRVRFILFNWIQFWAEYIGDKKVIHDQIAGLPSGWYVIERERKW